GVVRGDADGEGLDRDDLGDGVEVPPGVQLHVDQRERLQPRAEAAAGASHALGDGADLAVPPREQGDDAVRLAQRVGAQDDRIVTVELAGHGAPRLRRGHDASAEATAEADGTSLTPGRAELSPDGAALSPDGATPHPAPSDSPPRGPPARPGGPGTA